MLKLFRTVKYWIFWKILKHEYLYWEYLHYKYMEKFASFNFTSWSTHHERFNFYWRFGLAIDYSPGEKTMLESSRAIHFPAQGGRWVRVLGKFYFQTKRKGYGQQK